MIISNSMKLRYENSLNENVELSLFSVYTLENYEDSIENEIISQKQGITHGEKEINASMSVRNIMISGVIDPRLSLTLHKRLVSIMNPSLNGTLWYVDEDVAKKIEVKPIKKVNIMADQGIIKWEIELRALDPFWKDIEKVEHLAILSKSLKFPLLIPAQGLFFGLRRPILESKIKNPGDVRSGFKVVFKASGGTVKNPILCNKETGSFIKLDYAMEKGDIIEILNFENKKRIYINGINGFSKLNIESEFFLLDVGENLIGYSADENIINLDVIVYFTPNFLEVY